MRFLRLDFRDDLNSLDFHPLVTVVSSLGSSHQRQLFEAVRRLSSGSTVGLRGLVEHDGLLFELDASSGDPLAPVTTTAAVLVYVDGVAARSSEIGLQAEIDQWERQAAIDAVAVEEIRSNLDLAIKAKAYGLRSKYDLEPGSPEAAASGQRAKVAAIRAAIEAVNAHEATVAECDPQILGLIEQWEDFSERRLASDEHLRQIASEVRDAERQVAERSRELDISRQAARPVLLTPEEETRLESLCDQHSEQSRLGKWKKALSDEEATERQRLLDTVGVKSWTEYSVFRMSPTVPADKQRAVDDAEAELNIAKQALERAKSYQANDPVSADLSADLERIKLAAKPYLGVLVPTDVGAALADQIVSVENSDWADALNDLRDVLSSNDLHPPYGFEPSEILGWTDSWLRAEESLDPGADVSSADEGASDVDPVEELNRANHALARHNRALAHIAKAERAAVRSAMRVRDLNNQLRNRTANQEPTTGAEVLAMIAPVAEQVLQDVGGSVPIAVVGDLGELPAEQVQTMMGAIEEVAQQVQVIMVTSHTGIIDWVDQAGLERAAHSSGTRVLI